MEILVTNTQLRVLNFRNIDGNYFSINDTYVIKVKDPKKLFKPDELLVYNYRKNVEIEAMRK